MKRKIVLLTLGGLLFIVGVGFYVFFINRKNINITNFGAPPLNIPSYIAGHVKMESSLKETDFNFPASLPIFNVGAQTDFSSDEAKKYAQNFGFTSEPIQTNDILEGQTYIWSTEKDTLIIYSKSRRIDYSLNTTQQAVNKQLSKDAVTQIAKQFLVDKGLFSTNDINFAFFTFLGSNPYEGDIEVTTQSQASIYQVNFTYNILGNKNKIVTLNKNNSPIQVSILLDGTVYSVKITINNNIIKSSQEYSLKTFSQVISSLNAAKIVSLGDGTIAFQGLTSDSIKKVILNQIDLAYLMDSATTKIFQPVYLLTGNATIDGQNAPVKAVFYLPAIAGQ